MKFLRVIFLALVLAFSYAGNNSFAQCPMCKTALTKARENGETKVGGSINAGIMYMLAFPYLIAGTFGFIYYRSYKLKKQKPA